MESFSSILLLAGLLLCVVGVFYFCARKLAILVRSSGGAANVLVATGVHEGRERGELWRGSSGPSHRGANGSAGRLVLQEGNRDLAIIERKSLTGQGTRVPANMMHALSPLMERVPSLVEGARSMSSDGFRVVLKPEFLKGARIGSFRMMQSRELEGAWRLNVIRAEPGPSGEPMGRIVGQGSLVPAGEALGLATAAFQIATFVTAQMHLAEINARLAELKDLVEDVLNHLRNEQVGGLLGNIYYLHQVADQLKAGKLQEVEILTLNGQLETVERESLQVSEAILREVDEHVQNLERVNLANWFSTAHTDFGELWRALNCYWEAVRRYELALWVRCLALELKGQLPVDQ